MEAPARSVEKGRKGKWTAPAGAPPLALRWGRKSWAKAPSCVHRPGAGPAVLETVCSRRVLTPYCFLWSLVDVALPALPFNLLAV